MTGNKTYFDHNATTPVDPSVLAELPKWAAQWGNASSIHWAGRGPKQIIRNARRDLAEVLGCHPLELVFTSGGSEANNLALKGALARLKESSPQRREVVISAIEHPSVSETAKSLAQDGWQVKILPVSLEGKIDFEFLAKELSERTALVSCMSANNETGLVLPVKKIAKLAHEHGALVHSDCVQALGKIPINVRDLDVDLASFSAHKVYSLKGAGLLYQKKGVQLTSLIHGGGQERYRRGGTENTLAIAAFGHMARKLQDTQEILDKRESIEELRDGLESQLLSLSGVEVIHRQAKRLPNTSCAIIDDVYAETLLMNLDMKGFAVSTGAACSSGRPEPSASLLALGLSHKQAQSSLRISLGWGSSPQQVNEFIDVLKSTVLRLRKLNATANEEVI